VRRLGAVALLIAAVLVGCGGSSGSTEAPWRATHPDPPGMTFEANAPGICVFSAQFPEQAPAAISYMGTTWVQRTRSAAPAQPPGTVVGHSGDWTVSTTAAGLELDTGSALFDYRHSGSC
jgi:hypothetical protein